MTGNHRSHHPVPKFPAHPKVTEDHTTMWNWFACILYHVCSLVMSLTSRSLEVTARAIARECVSCARFLSKVSDQPLLKACIELCDALHDCRSIMWNKPVMKPDMRFARHSVSSEIHVEYAVTTQLPLDTKKATQIFSTRIYHWKQNPVLPGYSRQFDRTELTGHGLKDQSWGHSMTETIFSKVIRAEDPQEVESRHIPERIGTTLQYLWNISISPGNWQGKHTLLTPNLLILSKRFLKVPTTITDLIERACSKLFSVMLCHIRCSVNVPINVPTVILLILISPVSARPIKNEKTSSNNLESGNSIKDFAENLLSSVCLMLLVLMVPFVCRRIGFRDELRTSTIMAFSSAMSKLVGNVNAPAFWTVTTSGLSIGSSFWLARMTMSPSDSVMAHLLRYAIVGALVYQMLYISELKGQDPDSGISTTFAELSILSSVILNAIYNEKMRQLRQKLQAVGENILATLRLQRVPTKEIE